MELISFSRSWSIPPLLLLQFFVASLSAIYHQVRGHTHTLTAQTRSLSAWLSAAEKHMFWNFLKRDGGKTLPATVHPKKKLTSVLREVKVQKQRAALSLQPSGFWCYLSEAIRYAAREKENRKEQNIVTDLTLPEQMQKPTSIFYLSIVDVGVWYSNWRFFFLHFLCYASYRNVVILQHQAQLGIQQM